MTWHMRLGRLFLSQKARHAEQRQKIPASFYLFILDYGASLILHVP